MRRRLTAPLSLLVLATSLGLWLAAVPIASAGDPCYHGFAMPSQTTATNAQVRLLPCAFSPTVTRVDVGEMVTFVNGPDFTHLVTGANQAWGSRDAELQPGTTVSYAFDTAGAYPYACALHRGMSGVILVGETDAADGAAAAGTTGGTSGTATRPLDGGPILLGVLVGAVLGGVVIWFASRRRTGRRSGSASGLA